MTEAATIHVAPIGTPPPTNVGAPLDPRLIEMGSLVAPAWTKLRGIRTVDTGGDGTGAGAPADPPAGGAPADPPAAGAPAPAGGADEGQGPVGGVEFKDLDPKTQDAVRELRREAQTARTEKSSIEQTTKTALQADFDARMKAVTDALGITTKDEQPDPTKLAEQLTATQAAQATTQREIAVLRYAASAQVNGDMLLDSKAFEATLAGVNPTDAAAVKAKVEEWVTNHPTYKTATADTGSGTGGAGTGGSTGSPRPTTLVDAFKASAQNK